MDRETLTVAVCGTNAPNLEQLAGIVAKAGHWGVVPIHWPNTVAWEAARGAHLYVVDSGALCAELVENLRDCQARIPLVAIGAEPVPASSPDIWLPIAPPATLLASLLGHLLEGREEDITMPIPSWRRKSDMIIGNSPQLRQLRGQLDQLSAAQTPVLITGESGVGKELVARSLHFCGPRSKFQFVAINCAAIPENLFESELFGYTRGAFTGAVNALLCVFVFVVFGLLFFVVFGVFLFVFL